MHLSSAPKVQLDLLRKLGLPNDQVSEVREHLHRQNDLAVNGAGQVAIDTLEGAARAVEAHLEKTGAHYVPLPAAKLRALIAPPKGDRLTIAADAPAVVPTAHAAEAVAHADGLAHTVDVKAFGKQAEAVTKFLEKHAPPLAEALTAGTATVGDLGRALGTPDARRRFGHALPAVLGAVGKAGGPAYTSQDVDVDLSSNFRHLDGSTEPGQVGLYQKRMFENLFVKRDKEVGKFTLHGFERDKLVVTIPPGATVLLLDGKGNQTGARIPAVPTTIDGNKHNAVTVSRSMVQHPDRKMFETNPQFGIRVMDKSGEVLFERNLAFSKKYSHFSQKIFSGQVDKQALPEADLAELWDNYNPNGGRDTAPIGERPRFTVDGQSGDRVRLRQDGKTFDLNRWVQFLEPPRGRTDAFKAEKGFVRLEARNTSDDTLDSPSYDPTASGKLRDSYGHGITFDRSLKLTKQAHWGSQGLRVFDGNMGTVLAQFDPLTDRRR